MGWLLVGVELVRPNAGEVVAECEKNRLVSGALVV